MAVWEDGGKPPGAAVVNQFGWWISSLGGLAEAVRGEGSPPLSDPVVAAPSRRQGKRGLRSSVAFARIKFLTRGRGQMMTSSNRHYAEEEQVPFLFVPHGQTPPADWLARHPGWISFPATLVPRREGNPGDGNDTARGPESSHQSSGQSKRGRPELASLRLSAFSTSPDGIGFPSIGATDGDPIAAYRTINRVFDNPLASTVAASDSGTPSLRTDKRYAPAPAGTPPSGWEPVNDKRIRQEPEIYSAQQLRSMSDKEYGNGTDVVLPDGSFVDDPKSPTGHMRSPTQDLMDVAREGNRVRKTFKSMLKSPKTAAAAPGYLLLQLGFGVGQGGEFDYQRRGSMFYGYRHFPDFQAVSNFNVGLFAQEAGLSLDETLRIAGLFARLFSKNARPAQEYGLDSTVVTYIRKGFAAGQSGMFDKKPEGR